VRDSTGSEGKRNRRIAVAVEIQIRQAAIASTNISIEIQRVEGIS
jgi:hypothetical protein